MAPMTTPHSRCASLAGLSAGRWGPAVLVDNVKSPDLEWPAVSGDDRRASASAHAALAAELD